MTMIVQATTDQVPGLAELIGQRRAHGLDLYDEWWEGVYRIVPVPGRRHGRLVVGLGTLLDRAAKEAGLQVAAPINIGVDKHDARVPDLGVVRPDVEMTSPAFHASAELVVEILSPLEIPGEKLPFYAAWNGKEYLEIDLGAGSCRLLRNEAGSWQPVTRSSVIDLEVSEVESVIAAL